MVHNENLWPCIQLFVNCYTFCQDNLKKIQGILVKKDWYMETARVVSYVPGTSPHCFRGCGKEGTPFHIWWTCPKVKRFWTRLYNLIYSLAQVNLKKSPSTGIVMPPSGEAPVTYKEGHLYVSGMTNHS